MGGGKRLSHEEEIRLGITDPYFNNESDGQSLFDAAVKDFVAIEDNKINLKRKSTKKIINKVIKKSRKAITKRSK